MYSHAVKQVAECVLKNELIPTISSNSFITDAGSEKFPLALDTRLGEGVLLASRMNKLAPSTDWMFIPFACVNINKEKVDISNLLLSTAHEEVQSFVQCFHRGIYVFSFSRQQGKSVLKKVKLLENGENDFISLLSSSILYDGFISLHSGVQTYVDVFKAMMTDSRSKTEEIVQKLEEQEGSAKLNAKVLEAKISSINEKSEKV